MPADGLPLITDPDSGTVLSFACLFAAAEAGNLSHQIRGGPDHPGNLGGFEAAARLARQAQDSYRQVQPGDASRSLETAAAMLAGAARDYRAGGRAARPPWLNAAYAAEELDGLALCARELAGPSAPFMSSGQVMVQHRHLCRAMTSPGAGWSKWTGIADRWEEARDTRQMLLRAVRHLDEGRPLAAVSDTTIAASRMTRFTARLAAEPDRNPADAHLRERAGQLRDQCCRIRDYVSDAYRPRGDDGNLLQYGDTAELSGRSAGGLYGPGLTGQVTLIYGNVAVLGFSQLPLAAKSPFLTAAARSDRIRRAASPQDPPARKLSP
jgi:hypothetical protein